MITVNESAFFMLFRHLFKSYIINTIDTGHNGVIPKTEVQYVEEQVPFNVTFFGYVDFLWQFWRSIEYTYAKCSFIRIVWTVKKNKIVSIPIPIFGKVTTYHYSVPIVCPIGVINLTITATHQVVVVSVYCLTRVVVVLFQCRGVIRHIREPTIFLASCQKTRKHYNCKK